MPSVPGGQGPRPGTRALVAVYPDLSVATCVRDELVTVGVDESAVTIGDRGASAPADPRARAGAPATSVRRIAVVVGVLGVFVGAALGVALFDFGTTWLDALAGAALVGPLFAVIGAVIGGSAGPAPTRDVAAPRGVPLEVVVPPHASPKLQEVLLRWSPRRLDEFRDGDHVACHVEERPPAPLRVGHGFRDPAARS